MKIITVKNVIYPSKMRKKSLGFKISCCLFCITGTQTFNDMFVNLL